MVMSEIGEEEVGGWVWLGTLVLWNKAERKGVWSMRLKRWVEAVAGLMGTSLKSWMGWPQWVKDMESTV